MRTEFKPRIDDAELDPRTPSGHRYVSLNITLDGALSLSRFSLRRRAVAAAFAAAVPLAALAILAAARPAQADTVTVFAAASMADAMTEIADAYEAESGDTIRLSFASSSTLARQIEAGAPADLYASANERWMDYLEERHLIVPESRVSPFGNALVLVSPADAGGAALDPTDGGAIAEALGPDGRLAVGDPDHVPAGIYARQALESLGHWQALEPRLARADDVRAALALVETGEVPLGIVYATDARVSDGVAVVGTFPADSHAPIIYPIALVGPNPTPAAEAFFDHLLGPAAAAVFQAAGFMVLDR